MKGTLKSNDSNEQQQSHWHNLHTLVPSLSKCFFRCFFLFTFHTLKQMVTVIMQALTFVRHTYFSWKRMFHDSHEKKNQTNEYSKKFSSEWINLKVKALIRQQKHTTKKFHTYIYGIWQQKMGTFLIIFVMAGILFDSLFRPDYCVTFVKHENSTLEFCMLRLEFQVFNLIWNEHFKLEFLIYF